MYIINLRINYSLQYNIIAATKRQKQYHVLLPFLTIKVLFF